MPEKEREVDDLVGRLARIVREDCPKLLNRDFTDEEQVRISKGFEALECEIRNVVLGPIIGFQVTEMVLDPEGNHA